MLIYIKFKLRGLSTLLCLYIYVKSSWNLRTPRYHKLLQVTVLIICHSCTKFLSKCTFFKSLFVDIYLALWIASLMVFPEMVFQKLEWRVKTKESRIINWGSHEIFMRCKFVFKLSTCHHDLNLPPVKVQMCQID